MTASKSLGLIGLPEINGDWLPVGLVAVGLIELFHVHEKDSRNPFRMWCL